MEKEREMGVHCPKYDCPSPYFGWTLLRKFGGGLREYLCKTCHRTFEYNIKTGKYKQN